MNRNTLPSVSEATVAPLLAVLPDADVAEWMGVVGHYFRRMLISSSATPEASITPVDIVRKGSPPIAS